MRVISALVVFLLIIFFYSPIVYAASITFQNAKPALSSPDDEYTVDIVLDINANDNAVYYLRGVFYKPDSSNYCGFTWNNNLWFSGPYTSNEGWKNFLAVSINNNSWSGELKAKIDSSDSGCNDSGEYRFKVQRFTANSASGSFDTQTEQVVQITIPTPTPSPTPTMEPSNTPSPTKEPTHTPTPVPSKTPIPTLTPIKTPTVLKNTLIPTSKLSSILTKLTNVPTDYQKQEVLGNKIVTYETPTAKKSQAIIIDNLGLIFIAIGGVFLIACAILVIATRKRDKIL